MIVVDEQVEIDAIEALEEALDDFWHEYEPTARDLAAEGKLVLLMTDGRHGDYFNWLTGELLNGPHPFLKWMDQKERANEKS